MCREKFRLCGVMRTKGRRRSNVARNERGGTQNCGALLRKRSAAAFAALSNCLGLHTRNYASTKERGLSEASCGASDGEQVVPETHGTRRSGASETEN